MTRNNTRLSSQGEWEVTRRFTVPGIAHELDARAIDERLRKMPGVRGTSADIKRHRLTVLYDLTQSDCLAVLAALEEIGFPAADNRWARFKANYFQYLDTNGRDNANAPAAPCCSNPKGGLPAEKIGRYRAGGTRYSSRTGNLGPGTSITYL